MALILRPHQQQAIDDAMAAISFGETQIMMNAFQAWGKSLGMAELSRELKDDGVIIVVSIDSLVVQLHEHFIEQGLEHSVLKAGMDDLFDPDSKIQIVMIQTFNARIKKNPNLFGTTFKYLQADEYHRYNQFSSNTMQEFIDHIKPKVIIGWSGTPYDSKGFKFSGFEYINSIQPQELCDMGYLSPIKYYVPKWAEAIDYSKVKVSSTGEYDTAALDEIVNTENHLQMALESMNKMNAKSKRTIVFCTSIEQCEHFTKILQEDGYKAYSAHSKTKHKIRIIDAFRTKTTFNLAPKTYQPGLLDTEDLYPEIEIDCLVSVSALTIGFNAPSANLCVLLRAFKSSMSMYSQASARICRTAPNKKYAEILDLANCISTFGFLYDPYDPPERTGDKETDKQTIYKAKSKNALPNLLATLSGDNPLEITREYYDFKIKEIRSNIEKLKQNIAISENADSFDILTSAFDAADNIEDLMIIACRLEDYLNGYQQLPWLNYPTPHDHKYLMKADPKSKIESDFYIPHEMTWYFDQVPDRIQKRWLKAFKTSLKKYIKKSGSLFKIRGFAKYLYGKWESENNIYDTEPQHNGVQIQDDEINRIKANLSNDIKINMDECPF